MENAANQARTSRKGLNIFYYGKGKGKTTAAMGLAVRAAGAGMNVFVLQFVKAKRPEDGEKLQPGEWPISSEISLFEELEELRAKNKNDPNVQKIGAIENTQIGLGFVGMLGDRKLFSAHVEEAHRGLDRARELITSDKYDLIVLDELVSALELQLITEQEILNLLSAKPKHLHLAYTGHDKFDKIIAASDMVSEINMVKHPFYDGILAQRGIDF